MIHHASFCAPDPASAAHGLASLLGADVLRAPSPPFPNGSWFVLLPDDEGSMVEVLPADLVYRPDVPGSLVRVEAAPSWAQSHLLFSTPLTQQEIDETVARLGWRSATVNSGLFEFTKVWVQNHFLVELMTASQAPSYRRHFGRSERARLDDRLRELERTLSAPALRAAG